MINSELGADPSHFEGYTGHLFNRLIVASSLRPYGLQSPLSIGFPRQEPWSELPFPSPGDLPDPGIEPVSPGWQADSPRPSPWPRTLWAWTQWILNSRGREAGEMRMAQNQRQDCCSAREPLPESCLEFQFMRNCLWEAEGV